MCTGTLANDGRLELSSSMMWSDGSTTLPSDQATRDTRYITLPLAGEILAKIVCGIMLVRSGPAVAGYGQPVLSAIGRFPQALCAGCVAFYLVFRNNDGVRASSARMNAVSFTGCASLARGGRDSSRDRAPTSHRGCLGIAAAWTSLENPPNAALCNSQVVLLALAFTAFYGSLFLRLCEACCRAAAGATARTGCPRSDRVHRIFNNTGALVKMPSMSDSVSHTRRSCSS
jgi:hypothetical protein